MTSRLKKLFESRPRIVLISIIIVGLILVEMMAGLTIALTHRVWGTPKRISVFRFHPLFTGENIAQYESNWVEVYPVLGYINRVHYSDECGYTTDSYGFIHNGDKSRQLTEDRFKIFILGGSTIAGHGSSCNDQTISAHLEKLLRARYKHIDVINAGVSGYRSPEEFLRLTHQIMFYHPDIVISFNGTNDFMFPYKEYKSRKHSYFVSQYDQQLFQTLAQTRSVWWSIKNFIYNLVKFNEYTYTRFVMEKGISFLLGKSGSSSKSDVVTNVQRIVGVRNLPARDIQYQDEHFEPELDERLSYYLSYLKQTQAVVEGLGGKYFYFLQPILLAEKRYLPESEEKARKLTRYAFYKKDKVDIVKRARYFWKRADELVRQTNIQYADLTDIFSDQGEFYSDFDHYTDQGNAFIAEKLFQALCDSHAIPGRLEIKGE